jgi:hypothetical protein
LTATAEKSGHARLDGRRAENFGVAELDQNRTFGMAGVVTDKPDRAQLAGFAAAWS